MTDRKLDLERVRRILEKERARLQTQTRRMLRRDSLADQSEEIGDLADYDNHPADAATDTFEREKDLAIDENTADMIDAIDRALEKIDEGTYGICDRCGNDISKERLRALPYAAFCIECQDIVEGR